MKIVESSILLDPDFQKDADILYAAFEEGFNNPYVNDVISSGNKIFDQLDDLTFDQIHALYLDNKISDEVADFYLRYIETGLPFQATFKTNFQISKGTVNLAIAITIGSATIGYFHHTSNTIGIVIPRHTNPATFFRKNKESIKNTLVHELTHRYKREYRKELRKKKRKEFNISGADYALYDEERETHLSEMWREMEECHKKGTLKFEDCLYNSPTFLFVIDTMGGFSKKNKVNAKDFLKLPKKYQQLYKYFLKKLLEKWSASGYWKDEARGSFGNIDKETKKSFFRGLLNKFLV